MLPCADPRLHLGDDLLQKHRRLDLPTPLGRGQHRGQFFLDDLGHDGADRGGAQNLLGLTLELGLGQSHRDHRREPGQDVIFLDLVRPDLEPAGVDLQLSAEDLEHRLLEARHVGAALVGGDDVDKRNRLGVITGAPPQRHVNVALAFEVGWRHTSPLVEHWHVLVEGP